MQIQETATIRQRGQLTIPDKIRDKLRWARPDSVITIQTTSKNELVLKPYTRKMQQKVKKIDWDDVWIRIKKSRSIKGKRGNLSAFIARDRYRH